MSTADVVVIGRRHSGSVIDLDLSPDSQVSHRQACITFENGEYWIEDLDSKHGTWLNERKITQKTRLNVGDKMRLGQTTITRLEERETISPSLEINRRSIKGNQNFSLLSVNYNFKTPVTSRISMDCLPKAHLVFWIFFPTLLVRPTIFRQKDLRHKKNSAW